MFGGSGECSLGKETNGLGGDADRGIEPQNFVTFLFAGDVRAAVQQACNLP